MAQYNRTAYSSLFQYPIIASVHNLPLTEAAHPAGIGVATGVSYIPYYKAFAEFVPGELSPFWGSDANYIFSSNYETADIYGGMVYAVPGFIYIVPYWGLGMTTCNVHLRIYEGDYRNGF